MNKNTRIQLHDTGQDVIVKMCDGNPGALQVILRLIQHEPAIDPHSALGPFGSIFSLDSHGIYGSKIWILYKDICGSSLPKMVGVLRAVQLGMLPESALVEAVDYERPDWSPATVFNVDEACARVKEHLPRFNLEYVEAPAGAQPEGGVQK